MKKFSIILSTLLTVAAFADIKQVKVTGQTALELFDRLERTGLQRNTYEFPAGVKNNSIYLREMLCDNNSHYTPSPSQCTLMGGFMEKPIFSDGDKARNILAAMYPIEDAGQAQDAYFGDCAMGHCTTETGNVNCDFKDTNPVGTAECTVDAREDI